MRGEPRATSASPGSHQCARASDDAHKVGEQHEYARRKDQTDNVLVARAYNEILVYIGSAAEVNSHHEANHV